MTTTELEARIAALERKVEMLAAQKTPPTNKQWLLEIWGRSANDPDFQQAITYGRRWRKVQNRKSLKTRKSASKSNRHK
jgi:hypothetical protein